MARLFFVSSTERCVQAENIQARAGTGDVMSVDPRGQPVPPALVKQSKGEHAARLQLFRAAVALDELCDLIEQYAPIVHSDAHCEIGERGLRALKNSSADLEEPF